MFEGQIRDSFINRLASVAVDVGARVARGQEVVVVAPTSSAPLVAAIAERAYARGASIVTPLYMDRRLDAVRARHGDPRFMDAVATWMWEGLGHAISAGAARISVSGDDPDAMVNAPADAASRVSSSRQRAYVRALKPDLDFAVNWTIVPYPTPEWAAFVFPDVPLHEATSFLARDVEAVTRCGADDPVASWRDHNRSLKLRCDALNACGFAALRFLDDGTDLTVGLARGHRWVGGETACRNGIVCNANIPTEEVFTAPDRASVEGVARATRPLSYEGTLVEGLEVRFEAGRAVAAKARRGLAAFEKLLSVDEGAARLGEVALVPASSPVAATGRLFYNTLLDENAACHVAQGGAYPKCSSNADGLNASGVHVDWMLGSPRTRVDGVRADGSAVPVMVGGEWALGA